MAFPISTYQCLSMKVINFLLPFDVNFHLPKTVSLATTFPMIDYCNALTLPQCTSDLMNFSCFRMLHITCYTLEY